VEDLHVRGVIGPAWGRLILFPALLLITAVRPASAVTYPDITGVWTGALSGTHVGCTFIGDNGPFSSTDVVTFKNQSNGNFEVTLVDTDNSDGSSETLTGSGMFTGPTQIQFALSNNTPGDLDTVLITADISGAQMTFNFSGNNVGGDGCSFSGNGSLTRSGGNLTALNPATEASSTITNVALFNTQLANVTTSLGTHIGSTLRGGPQGFAMNGTGFGYEQKAGLNAGDGAFAFGLWGNYTYSDFDNDLSSTAFDGHSHSLLGGIDYAPFKNTVLGLAVGYSFSDVDTSFNRGHQENDTFTIAPYFGAVISDTWSLDASIGYSRVSTDQFRTAPGTGTQISSSPDSDRWFGSINLNGVTYYNNWILGARAGVLRASNNQGSFAESNGVLVPSISNQLGTLSIGANVAYSYGNYEPFASITYENDYRLTRIAVVTGPQPSNDQDDFLLGLGVRYYGPKGLSGSLEWNRRLGRSNFDEDLFSFSLRADF